jgi:hypothetical protein
VPIGSTDARVVSSNTEVSPAEARAFLDLAQGTFLNTGAGESPMLPLDSTSRLQLPMSNVVGVVATLPSTPDQPDEVTWRPKGPIFGEVVVVVGVAFVAELILVAVLPEVLGLLSLLVAIAAAVYGCSRAGRLSLSVSSAGVSIRNYLKSYDIPWTEIEAAGVGAYSIGVAPQLCISFKVRGRRSPIPSQATLTSRRLRREVLSVLNDRTRGLGIEVASADDAS